MRDAMRRTPRMWAMLLAATCALAGCLHNQPLIVPPPDGTVPTEMNKVLLPRYVIEPPDILQVDVFVAPKEVEKSPYSTALPPQPIGGQHHVGMDGTIELGIYGSVQVAGLTLDQARERIREFLIQQSNINKQSLQVSVGVIAYNSKAYYVITDGAGYGEQVSAFPVTGSETVLDALSRIGGIPAVGSKRHIWVARRSKQSDCPDQILPVDWCGITQQGNTNTNYQVLPGDRIYVRAQPIITTDNTMAKFLAPIERTFGIILLGSGTVHSIRTNGENNNGNNNNNPF